MILVIDDDVEDFDIISEAIKTVKPSARLKYFENAEECLSKLPQMDPKPSIILLDINMPKMNGMEFLKEFQKNKTLSKIPIVILSTTCVQEQKKNCATLGAVNYISKPTSWAESLATAKNILTIEETYS